MGKGGVGALGEKAAVLTEHLFYRAVERSGCGTYSHWCFSGVGGGGALKIKEVEILSTPAPHSFTKTDREL